ncbi:MAG TPA: efflux RND transporter permease subunit [Rhizomicrobium sp.]|nr:efflux RND transporter permease subunit [Rhizomicrobium sp.]
MNLSAPFIKRPVMTCLVMAALVIFGLFGYAMLPVSELPNVDFPTINVQANLPGADPETMASAVATPLENAFATVPGLESMTSRSSIGNTNITLQFHLERNVDIAATDVEAAITGVLRRLPRNMPNPPSLRKNDPSQAPIFFVSLYSDTVPISKVDQYARSLLATQLSTLEGVSQVNIMGQARFAVRIQADPAALAARHMTLLDLGQAVAATNSNQASGTLNGPTKNAIIRTEGQLDNANAYRKQVIAYRDGGAVTFGDVAKVVDSFENVRSIDWLNDERAVTVAVQRQPDSNTMAIVDQINKVLPRFAAQLPAGIQMKVFYDRSQTIRAAVHDVQFTLILAAVLVVAVIFLFLRTVSATIIPSLALPITVLGTFAGMSLLNFNLDNLSLMALTLSVGFVVDDAIVMLENIVRHVELGETPYRAACRGSEEIAFTILSMTLSLAAVFIPILFMSGIVGRLLHEFAVTIIIAILISGFVSVTLTPMLCARVLKNEHKAAHGWIYRWNEMAFMRLQHAYDRSLKWSLRHRKVILGVFAASILANVGMFAIMQQDFLPSDDTGQLHGSVQTQTGTSFDQVVAYTRRVMKVVQADPDVADVQGDEGGDMNIALKPLSERSLSADEVVSKLRGKLRNIPGTAITFNNPPIIRIGGRFSRSTYQYTLQGLDLTELQQASEQLTLAMQDDPTFVGVNSDQDKVAPTVKVAIDRSRAAALGVTPDDIQNTLGLAFGGQQVSQIYATTDQYQVILELLPEYQLDASGLSRLYLRGTGGGMVPLTAVTQISRRTMPPAINHSGQIPAITLSFDLARGKALSDAVAGVRNATDKIGGLPTSVSGSFAGTAAAFQSSTSNMGWLLLVAVIVVYIILGILYESFIHPLTILSGLPSAALGALLMLYVTQIPLTLYAFVGMIMLVGIVKKNAIMMIDFALQKQRGHDAVRAADAIYEAAIVRFRPIMMTTMAALMGTLPIALGSGMGADARRPLGLCVTGGLLFSQLLTLYITPVLYTYLDNLQKRFGTFRTLEDEAAPHGAAE